MFKIARTQLFPCGGAFLMTLWAVLRFLCLAVQNDLRNSQSICAETLLSAMWRCRRVLGQDSSSCSAVLGWVYGHSSLPEHANKAFVYPMAADANAGFMPCLPATAFLTAALLRPNVIPTVFGRTLIV